MDGVTYYFMDVVQGVFDIVTVAILFHLYNRQSAYEIADGMNDKRFDKIETQIKNLQKKRPTKATRT